MSALAHFADSSRTSLKVREVPKPDMVGVIRDGHASSAAAGSFFVFHGKHRAVLITYPDEAVVASSLAGL